MLRSDPCRPAESEDGTVFVRAMLNQKAAILDVAFMFIIIIVSIIGVGFRFFIIHTVIFILGRSAVHM